MNRLALFETELNYITSLNLRSFAEYVIDNADNYFFFIPASTSGKYHPPFDQGLGGLVRHTKTVAYMAHSLGMANILDPEDIDVLVVAALAHDIKKMGNGAAGRTIKEHPEQAVAYLKKLYDLNNCGVEQATFDLICDCVLSHMGQWGTVKPSTNLQFILHSADYIASRQELLSFDFGTMPKIDIEDAGIIEIPFGKYKGKTIKEIYDKDISYLKWIKGNDSFFSKVYQELISQYLDNEKTLSIDFTL